MEQVELEKQALRKRWREKSEELPRLPPLKEYNTRDIFSTTTKMTQMMAKNLAVQKNYKEKKAQQKINKKQ